MAIGKKTGGRTKGTTNKDVAPIREKFAQLLEGYSIELMTKDLKSIEPAERLRIVTGLAEFIVPKLQRTEVKNDDGNEITIRLVRE
jgi:hypothetical protein